LIFEIQDLLNQMGALTDRRDSDYEGEDTNLNVQWISHPLFWVFYVAIIAVLRWALFFVPESYISTEHAWTAWNLIHAVVRIPSVFCGRGGFRRLLLVFVPLSWFRPGGDNVCIVSWCAVVVSVAASNQGHAHLAGPGRVSGGYVLGAN
jgi:ORMDL family